MTERVFFAAYPASPSEISLAISAAEKINTSRLRILPWEQTFTPGHFIDQTVLPEIKKSDGLIVDVSTPNNNVFFEAGYAIGLKKPIIPICNSSINNSGKYLQAIGLFDNIGYQTYENGNHLRDILDKIKIPSPLFPDDRSINKKQSIYVLDALKRSQFAAKIISATKEAVRFFRSFDPNEEYRMSMRSAWDNVSQSTGVLVSFLSDNKDDHEFHNLRASLIAGLAYGMDKEFLILTDGEISAPLDFRDHCFPIKHPDDIANHINAFGVRALRKLSETSSLPPEEQRKLIQKVSMGSAAAENEFRSLATYYIDTAEFQAALSGHGRIVIGRKGSGKTAIFWRVRDTIRNNNKNVVVDLKPDGYQLRKFKEIIVKQLSQGTKEHTLTAFWEYLLYAELLYKIFEDDYQNKYGRDPILTAKLDKLKPLHESIMDGREGDFSERMMKLLEEVSQKYKQRYGEGTEDKFLTTDQVTDLIYKENMRNLSSEVLDYLSHKDRNIILIDNIDKGWGAHGVDNDDVTVVRTLIEALRKLGRQASRNDVSFDWLVFLRNDVFELLVEGQSDRGKEDKIIVDWDSVDALRQVAERRIHVSASEKGVAGAAWADIAKPIVNAEDSLNWVIQRSLMRPRYVIQLAHECIGHALTMGHSRIEEEDFFEGYRRYSVDVVGNTNFELRDVFSPAYDSIYCLIGLNRRTKIGAIKNVLKEFSYPEKDIPEIVRLFFWFGIIGTLSRNGEEKYIFNYRYDEKIFSRIRQTNLGDEETVFINIAFSAGLNCVDLI